MKLKTITSFIADFLEQTNKRTPDYKHNLQSFTLNVLDKRRTMIENSYHLYDFHFLKIQFWPSLLKFAIFTDFVFSCQPTPNVPNTFNLPTSKQICRIICHDQQTFDTPANWQIKTIEQSPLTIEFSTMWEKLREAYRNELSLLAFTQIPDEKKVAQTFINTVNNLIVKTQNK